MKKLKQFIDNLPIDKKGHIVLGTIINPLIISLFLLIKLILKQTVLDINIFLLGYLGVVFCCLFHLSIEFWQRKTGKGKFELLDAFAGSYSALKIGLIFFIIHILQ